MCFMDHKTQSSIGDNYLNEAMEKKSGKPKEKRRNNEKRKEKSRDAARCRRSRETEIFNELGETLPIRKDELDNLDKASVMRLAIATLKIEHMMKLFKINSEDGPLNQIFDSIDENAVMKALDGFLIALSADGDVTYVSNNIHEYIGIQQIDMIGNPIWDYTHQCDHIELRDILNIRRLEVLGSDQTLDDSGKMSRNALIRVKCTLTSRGRNVNIKSASYKVVNIVGHTVIDEQQRHNLFIGIARLVPHPSNIEVPLDSKTFLSKHSLNMKFSYVDDKMLSILGYKPNDLLERSLYEYHHGADSEMLMNAFKNVINKGQTETPQYRFLGRNGGFCWVVSQATIVYDKQKPQGVVCVNYVISGLMNENEIYSLCQLEFNTLLQNNKVKIKEKQIEFKLENIQIENKYSNYQKSPDLDVDKNNLQDKIDDIENTKSIELDSTIRRMFLANQLNITQIKGNPKAVTASVFKALPAIKPKLILSNNTNAQRVNKPTTKSSEQITSPFMKTESVDKFKSFGKVHSTISEPSILPRQTVVTASLFQPRLEKTEILFSNPSSDSYSTETMNKTLRNSNNDRCQTTSFKPSKDVDHIQNAVPSVLSSDSATSQKATFSTNFANDNSHPSLAESTPLFGEIFNELILPDGFCALLPGNIQSLDQAGKINIEDDFINYVEGRNVSTEKSNNVLISSNISKSRENNSCLPSLCSPNSISRNEEFTFMSTSLNNDDIDLSMRAPYIPMNENDDLPLLTEDLMWSAFSDEISLHKDIRACAEFQSKTSQSQPTSPENIDKLLMNDVQKCFSFVSPALNCINTKYINSESTITNEKKPIEKQFKNGQVQTSKPHTSCGDKTMINSVISIYGKNMLMKESIADCGPVSTAVINLKDDDYSSENEKVPTHPIQNEVFNKKCADNILLEWTMNNSTENNKSCNAKNCRNPSKHIFPCEIQLEKSKPNIMNANHKRCSPLEIGVIKRLRSHANSDYSDMNDIKSIQRHSRSPEVNQQSKNIQNSYLLQQLMAPPSQRSGKKARPESKFFEEKIEESTQWNHEAVLNRSEDQSPESVLKNLLTPAERSCDSNMMQHIQVIPENVKIENEANCIDSDRVNMYGLVEDVFLIDELSLNSESIVDDNMRGTTRSVISETRPFESFDEQITISVPQPPPLKAEAFTIGGGLFQGITDQMSILPTSLISPIGKNYFSGYDSIKSDTNNMMNIWPSELK